ncbi:GumC domain-containing protein [Chromobacterium vaccinii]|uniref:hypothetical protein n=1 Tax=Chromobacterium vaccinii TaxID=1108595 RepID=UPI0016430980|nr:hypothetical protein [Chromobacterium vaccinii]
MKSEEDEISLLQVAQFCLANWRLLLSGCVLSGMLGLAWSLSMPNIFSAKTLLLIAEPIGTKGGAALLQSDPVLKQAVEKFGLAVRYKRDSENEAKLALLNDHMKVSVAKDQPLEIMVTDTDPIMAARVANYLADLCRQQILGAHITEQGRKLYVLQGRLAISRERFKQAEKEVRADIQSGRLKLDSTAVQMVSGFASLEGMLAAGDTNNLDSALMQIKMELAKASGEVMALSPDLFTEVRDLYYHRALTQELARQVQQAELVASQDVQVLVEATPPLMKSSPKRSLIIAIAGLIGLAISTLLALILQLRRSGRLVLSAEK